MHMNKVGISVLVLAMVLLAGSVSAGERQGPRISVKDARFDFGMVSQGTRPEHIFEIKNTGDELLEITQIQPT
jgi:Protein of unknown function (DUF1573)